MRFSIRLWAQWDGRAPEMNGGGLYSPCVAVVVDKSSDGTKYVTADDHTSRQKQRAQRAPVIHPGKSGLKKENGPWSSAGCRIWTLKVSDCKVTLGFIVSVMVKRLQKSDIWRRGSVHHLCGALEGITAQRRLKKGKKKGRETEEDPSHVGWCRRHHRVSKCQGSVPQRTLLYPSSFRKRRDSAQSERKFAWNQI